MNNINIQCLRIKQKTSGIEESKKHIKRHL